MLPGLENGGHGAGAELGEDMVSRNLLISAGLDGQFGPADLAFGYHILPDEYLGKGFSGRLRPRLLAQGGAPVQFVLGRELLFDEQPAQFRVH